jgi:hypothetical protein
MERRHFLRIAGGGAIWAATGGMLSGCSSQLPADAIAAWQLPPSGQADALDPRRWILSHALLAPHAHNLQSWLVDVSRPGLILLYMDRTRMLPQTDPYSRQMMLSQGTFLEVLDLAARHLGWRAEIELFPEGVAHGPQVDFRPTALIRLRRDPSVRSDPLFAQVQRRHTNRGTYDSRLPPADARQALAQSTQGLVLRTGLLTSEHPEAMEHQRRIAKAAWRTELLTPRTMMESLKVLRIGPDEISRHRDGISINEPMLRAIHALGLFDRSQAPGPDDVGTQSQIEKFNTGIDSTQAFFWLVTEGNDRKTQVNAGRAWVRAQLAATAHGLSMHPLSQALQEYPEVEPLYREIHERLEAPSPRFTVQMWARLGFAPATGPSPRRGLEAHLIPV